MHLSVRSARRAPLFHVAPIRIQLSFSLWLALISLCVLRKINSMASPVAHTQKATSAAAESGASFHPDQENHTIASEPLQVHTHIQKLLVRCARCEKSSPSLYYFLGECMRRSAEIIPILKRAAANGPLLRTGSLKDWRVILIPFWIGQAAASPTEKALCARRHQHQQQRQRAQSRAPSGAL